MEVVVENIFNQLLQFVQQGVASIFQFIHLIWGWTVGQTTTLVGVPWQDWPLWKQVLLVLIAAGIVWALYGVAMELFTAGAKILTAFAALLITLVNTLPNVLLAGVIALGGLWVLNHVDLSTVRLPTTLSWSSQATSE
ncbi:MAG: hypothetical protein ACREMY_18010 [bacterium]